MAKEKKINETHFDKVNWNSIEAAMKSSNMGTRHWISKRMIQDCGANAILYQRQKKSNESCPFCRQKETVLHVYQCQSKEFKDKWDQELDKLKVDMEKERTDPSIIENFTSGLMQWQRSEEMGANDLIQQQT
jgi:hypothetical protein